MLLSCAHSIADTSFRYAAFTRYFALQFAAIYDDTAAGAKDLQYSLLSQADATEVQCHVT